MGSDPLVVASKSILEAHTLESCEEAVNVAYSDFHLLATLHIVLVEHILVEREFYLRSSRGKVNIYFLFVIHSASHNR